MSVKRPFKKQDKITIKFKGANIPYQDFLPDENVKQKRLSKNEFVRS